VQPPTRWKILVVDGFTRTHLNALLKLDAILRENVTVVEVIEGRRDAQPDYEAAYLLCPTSQNVERIIRDLTPGADGRTQYAAGHVFFVDGEWAVLVRGAAEVLLGRLPQAAAGLGYACRCRIAPRCGRVAHRCCRVASRMRSPQRSGSALLTPSQPCLMRSCSA
jgi:hypothetical protein